MTQQQFPVFHRNVTTLTLIVKPKQNLPHAAEALEFSFVRVGHASNLPFVFGHRS